MKKNCFLKDLFSLGQFLSPERQQVEVEYAAISFAQQVDDDDDDFADDDDFGDDDDDELQNVTDMADVTVMGKSLFNSSDNALFLW